MRTIDFEKADDRKWYVVFEDYQGDYEDLEMVNGADTFLDVITSDDMTASIAISEEEPTEGTYSTLRMIDHDDYGATYQVENCSLYDKTIWLCNVAHLFFNGEHPDYIYFYINS